MAESDLPTYPVLSVTPSAGDGEGVTVHNLLTGRSSNNAHPISAVTGLADALIQASLPVDTALILDDLANPTEATIVVPSPGAPGDGNLVSPGWVDGVGAPIPWGVLSPMLGTARILVPYGADVGIYDVAAGELTPLTVYPGTHIIATYPAGAEYDGALFLPYNTDGVGGAIDRTQPATGFHAVPIGGAVYGQSTVIPLVAAVHDGNIESDDFFTAGPGSVATSEIIDSTFDASLALYGVVIALINQSDGSNGFYMLAGGDPTVAGNEVTLATSVGRWSTLAAGSPIYVQGGTLYGNTLLATVADGIETNMTALQTIAESTVIADLASDVGDLQTAVGQPVPTATVNTGGTQKSTTSATMDDLSGVTTTITLSRTSGIVALFSGQVTSGDNTLARMEIQLVIDGTAQQVQMVDALADGSTNGVTLFGIKTGLAAGTYTIKAQARRASGSGTPQVAYCQITAFATALGV